MSPSLYPPNNVDILDIRQGDMDVSLVEDIFKGLNPSDGTTRSMPTTLLYDVKGLKLFEEITYLAEYYLTDAEIDVLASHAKTIVERIPDDAQLVELGSGNLRKIMILLEEFEKAGKHVDYYAVDLSLPELQRTFSNVRTDDFAFVGLHGLYGTYDDALSWLSAPPNRTRPIAVLSMGSSIGNFPRTEAAKFLASFARALRPSDCMIVGLDGCKNPEKVFRAYNDAKGTTQAFYENGLLHANAVLGWEAFKPADWEIVTRYDEEKGCHEAFYSPRKSVVINGITIPKGEKLVFEEAFKYGPEEREELWRNAGLLTRSEFANESGDYHIHMLSPANLDFSTQVSQYASHAIPSLRDFRSLWTAWDIVTKAMVPRQELLSKPINLRNVLIFYLGHIPTFLDIHLTRALRSKPVEPREYQLIFERGIDPDVEDPEQCHAHSEIPDEWPPVGEIQDYQERVRDRVRSVYQRDGLEHNRVLGEALFIGFEHEAMHLETFLYMLLQSERTLPPPVLNRPDFEGMFNDARRNEKPSQWFVIPERTLFIGLEDSDETTVPDVSFGWDNEKPKRKVAVHAFEAKATPITNGEYAEYLQANKVKTLPASWASRPSGKHSSLDGTTNAGSQTSMYDPSSLAVRTVFGPVAFELARDWPVTASYDELAEYARWRRCRLPTYEEVRSIYSHSEWLKQAERHKATNGHSGQKNGVNGAPDGVNGHEDFSNINPTKFHSSDHQPVKTPSDTMPVFTDLDDCNIGFKHWHPVPVIQNGDRLAGQGELGGVWEWTSTPLLPHEGFKAMEAYPGYTADFFDGKHNIIQGGSWATHPRIAGRTTFINWYQRNYPYAWAGARLVRDIYN